MPDKSGGHFKFPGRFVIPGVLIILGALILANNLGYLSGDWWAYAKSLWPIVLILVGIDLLVEKMGR